MLDMAVEGHVDWLDHHPQLYTLTLGPNSQNILKNKCTLKCYFKKSFVLRKLMNILHNLLGKTSEKLKKESNICF